MGPPETIALMGDKVASKEAMSKPGSRGPVRRREQAKFPLKRLENWAIPS